MNRVAAMPKSSRTRTTPCARPPSQCRRAWISSAFSSLRLACSHCSNWSSTSSTFCPDSLRPDFGGQRVGGSRHWAWFGRGHVRLTPCPARQRGLLLGGHFGQEVPQVVGHVPGGRVALRGTLREGLQADAVQFSGDVV